MAKRWKQYLEKLYSGRDNGIEEWDNENKEEVDHKERGDCILQGKFELAMKSLCDGRLQALMCYHQNS